MSRITIFWRLARSRSFYAILERISPALDLLPSFVIYTYFFALEASSNTEQLALHSICVYVFLQMFATIFFIPFYRFEKNFLFSFFLSSFLCYLLSFVRLSAMTISHNTLKDLLGLFGTAAFKAIFHFIELLVTHFLAYVESVAASSAKKIKARIEFNCNWKVCNERIWFYVVYNLGILLA